MTSPLQGSIAAKIGKAFASTFYDAVVVRTVTAPAEGAPAWDRTETVETEYSCKAIVDGYTAYQKANSIVSAEDRKVLVLASSLSVVPKPGDRVTIAGETYTVRDVSTDPATAVWELRSRR